MQEQPRESSVMVHNAYNAKKCIPVGLYRLLCLKARGPWTAVRLMFQSLIAAQRDIWWARKAYRCFHSAKIYFVSLTTRPVTCRTGTKKTPDWPFTPSDRVFQPMCAWLVSLWQCISLSCSCESCNVHLQHNVNWALFIQLSSRCSNKAMKLNKPLG